MNQVLVGEFHETQRNKWHYDWTDEALQSVTEERDQIHTLLRDALSTLKNMPSAHSTDFNRRYDETQAARRAVLKAALDAGIEAAS